LSDVRVRHAMRMAIDVDEIISGVYGTRGLFVPAWTEFFREPYKCDIPRPEYDLEGAKALLEEAGWSDTDGDGVRECRGCTTGAPEGYEMRVELLTYAGWGEEAELAQQLVAEDLEDMGMATDVGQAEGAVIWADAEEGGTEATGNYDVDFYDDGYAGDKIGDFLWDYYHSDAIDMDYGFNQVRWSNEEFDALLDEANNTVDHEARLEAFCRMAEIMDEELPHIWLWQGLGASAHSERLNGVVTNPNTAITWNIADWTLND